MADGVLAASGTCNIRKNLLKSLRAVVLIGLATMTGRFAAAQASPSREDAFSAVAVRVSLLAPTNIGKLTPYYTAGNGGIVEITTPFHYGALGLGAGWMPFRRVGTPAAAAPNAGENFRAYLVGVGWETPPVAIGRLNALAGVRASTFRMVFNDTTVNPGIRTEDELQLGVNARATLPLTQRFGVGASASFSRVFLHVPLHVTSLSAGVEWKFAMPEKIRGWLRQ